MEQLTREYILQVLQSLDPVKQRRWMERLGYELTVAARGVYDGDSESKRLRGFNEIQHWVYGRLHDLQRGHEWPLDDFLGDCVQRARHYEVDGLFGAALRQSLKAFE